VAAYSLNILGSPTGIALFAARAREGVS